MATETSDLNVFKRGATQLLSTLTDETDDTTAANVIHFALQVVGTDVAKFGCLVTSICTKTNICSEGRARLLVKISEFMSTQIEIVREETRESFKGCDLILKCAIWACQREFEDSTSYHWPARSLENLTAIYMTNELSMTDVRMGMILINLVKHKHLFVDENFKQFVAICLTCGPKLDKDLEVDHLTTILRKTIARASTEATTYKVMLAGLSAIRSNDWKIETSITDRVLTPEDSSELESEAYREIHTLEEEGDSSRIPSDLGEG